MTLLDFVESCPADGCVVASIATRDTPDGREMLLDDGEPNPLEMSLADHEGIVDDLEVWRWNMASDPPPFRGSPITRISAWYDSLDKATELMGG